MVGEWLVETSRKQTKPSSIWPLGRDHTPINEQAASHPPATATKPQSAAAAAAASTAHARHNHKPS